MRYGVFSDVHGNLEGLTACLARFKKEGVDGYIHCGDIIGYGPDPEACVARCASLNKHICVVGNHDAVFAEPSLEGYFNREALLALEYSKKELSDSSIHFLTHLPAVYQGQGFTVVHGTPLDPIKEYFSSCMQFRVNYDLWKGQICFVGHTHLPFYIKGDQRDSTVFVSRKEDFTVKLNAPFRYIINPGSCGKPRDNDSRASFGIWDTEKKTFRFLRETYDFAPTQAKMTKAGLPSFLIDSLSLGI